jgi:hypothetical protein
MRDYFFGRFPSQLGLLAFRRPDSVVLEHIMRDHSVVFFGGPDWENVANDLRQVPENDRLRPSTHIFGTLTMGGEEERTFLSLVGRDSARTMKTLLSSSGLQNETK